jgi:hypothetical protein
VSEERLVFFNLGAVTRAYDDYDPERLSESLPRVSSPGVSFPRRENPMAENTTWFVPGRAGSRSTQ